MFYIQTTRKWSNKREKSITSTKSRDPAMMVDRVRYEQKYSKCSSNPAQNFLTIDPDEKLHPKSSRFGWFHPQFETTE